MNTVTPTQRRDTFIDELDAGPLPPGGLDERAERQAADLLRDAFASGPADRFALCRPILDTDGCQETVPNPQKFVLQKGDATDISPADIQQGRLSDCHLMAPLAALAGTEEGRTLIANAIAENKNEKGEVVSYAVTLHLSTGAQWLPDFCRKFLEVKITVDARYAVGHAATRPDDAGEVNEVWPLVLERAFAQLLGGYRKIDGAAYPIDALEALTGRPAKSISLTGWFPYTAGDLQRDLQAGKLIVGRTGSIHGDNPCGIVDDHAYAIVGTVTRDGSLFVQVRNPWDGGAVADIPWAEFKTQFTGVDVGSLAQAGKSRPARSTDGG